MRRGPPNPGALRHGAGTGINTIVESVEKGINYLRSLRLDPAGGSQLSPEDMRAMQDHVYGGGTEYTAGEMKRPVDPSAVTREPNAAKTALSRVETGDAPRTMTGKIVSGATEFAVEGTVTGAAMAPVKTARAVGKAGKTALEGVGVKPVTAQAAMYKNPAKDVNTFASKYLTQNDQKAS